MSWKLVALAPAVVALATLTPGSAEAAAPVLIGRTQYDSPGTDNRSATSLNAEYVTLKNATSTAKALKGWTLRDASNHVYTFPAFTLGAGKSVVLHTGRGTNSATNLYWGSTTYIWNNDGDTATLRTASGGAVDSCRWSSVGPGYTAC